MSGPADDLPVVTVRGLSIREAATGPDVKSDVPALERALLLNRINSVHRKLEEATNDSDPELFVTVQDREASLFQSKVAEDATEFEILDAGGKEVKFGNGLEDPFGWAKSLFDWVDRDEAHPIIRPSSTRPLDVGSLQRVALLADWGTGMYGAPISARSIAETAKSDGQWDLQMHLGDVYYAGTLRETKERFTAAWPKDSGELNRGINGNHEMYSGGFGYFQHTLSEFDQDASYFAITNDYWLLIGLDAAWVDHAIDQEQADWVMKVVADHKRDRKLVLFSHHQPYSRLSNQGPKLLDPLKPLLETRQVTAWYWGHEHDCVIYDQHDDYGVYGRCLGNGGIPALRRDEVRVAAVDSTAGEVTWRRLAGNDRVPDCVALDGPNRFIPKKQEHFLPHGYVTLEFGESSLIERFHLPDSTVIHIQEIA
jgi:Calcineurin-like phosphoesterase